MKPTSNTHFGWRPDRFAEILTPELADRLSSAVGKPVEDSAHTQTNPPSSTS